RTDASPESNPCCVTVRALLFATLRQFSSNIRPPGGRPQCTKLNGVSGSPVKKQLRTSKRGDRNARTALFPPLPFTRNRQCARWSGARQERSRRLSCSKGGSS